MRVMFFALTLLSCFGLFFVMMKMKGDVSTQLTERAQLVQEQRQLQEDLQVLRAEYAHLANLERLESLARAQGLVPLQVEQLMGWEVLR